MSEITSVTGASSDTYAQSLEAIDDPENCWMLHQNSVVPNIVN